jgi:hypothetical protein
MGVMSGIPRLKKFGRCCLAVLFAAALVHGEPSSVLWQKQDFDSRSLLGSGSRMASAGFSFLNPNRFSMHQSYSLSYASGSSGSMSSGLYLNTLSYRLSEPLTLSADLGLYTPISSTVPGMRQNSMMGTGSSVILPRLGLEYRPTENLSMNLELFNGPDAWKAYGSPFGPSFW